MTYSLITERRRHAPPGADGGEPGARGRNLLNGAELEPKATGHPAPGDRLTLETPGGGGHGAAWPKAPLRPRVRGPRRELAPSAQCDVTRLSPE